MSGMSNRQWGLARHALGLPNRAERSYRNRFIAGTQHRDYRTWRAMVRAGHAESHVFSKTDRNTRFCFSLTRQGADLAVLPGESLCPEDFP